MKTKKAIVPKIIFVGVIIVAAGYLIFYSFLYLKIWRTFTKEAKYAGQRQVRLLCETDYPALLKACREVSRMAADGELTRYEYHIRINPEIDISKFPKPILDLEPTYIDIGRDGSVRIELVGGFDHIGVNAYPEDYKIPANIFDFHYGDRKLIEGLWYYDDGYYNNPDYDKGIEEIIKKGKK